jgi:hypothetical protein
MKWDSQNVYDRLYLAWSTGKLGHAYLLLGEFTVIEQRIYRNLLPHLAAGHPHQVHTLASRGESGMIGIEETREFVQDLSRPVPEGSWRVGIVENAHRMTRPAANSLLKSLEEPGRGRIYLLQSPQRGSVMATIASRCQVLPVRDAIWSPPAWMASLLPKPGESRVATPLEAWSLGQQILRQFQARLSSHHEASGEVSNESREGEPPAETQKLRAALRHQQEIRQSDLDWRDILRSLSHRWPALAVECDQAQGQRTGILTPDITLGRILLKLTRP